MYSLLQSLASVLFFCQLGLGAPSPLQPLQTSDTTNCNTATNRACWISGSYDINTDYESNTPLTGNVRQVYWGTERADCEQALILNIQYDLTLTEQDNWVGPDGVTKEKVMLVNGMYWSSYRQFRIH